MTTELLPQPKALLVSAAEKVSVKSELAAHTEGREKVLQETAATEEQKTDKLGFEQLSPPALCAQEKAWAAGRVDEKNIRDHPSCTIRRMEERGFTCNGAAAVFITIYGSIAAAFVNITPGTPIHTRISITIRVC